MTQLDIINLALHHLACDRLTSLTGNDKRTEVMNDIYAPIRDQVLADGGWNFARKRVSLTKLTTAPAFEWECQFTMPTDFIKLWKEYNEEDVVNEGAYLMANSSPIEIVYVSRIVDTSVYSSGFVAALALKLASVAAYSLSQDKGLDDRLEAKYQNALSMARTNDSQSNAREEVSISDFLGDRA